jgi:energy-coupling factor transporter transmembrane protein EcfT
LARSLGMLLIRSLDRAERIHQAMQSRGGAL